MAKAKKGRPMQAVTQVSSLGDQTLFFSSSSKNTDSSFADIFAKECQATPTESKSETPSTPSTLPTETNKPEENKSNVSTETSETTKAESTDKYNKDIQAKRDEEAHKEKVNSPVSANPTSVAFLPTLTSKELLAKSNHATKWTEIPPVTLRLSGKSITSSDLSTTNNSDLSALAKNIKDLASLLAKLKDNVDMSAEERANLMTLISKISQSISSLQAQSASLSAEQKNIFASLIVLKESLSTSLQASNVTSQAINLQPSTDQTALSIATLLQDLQGYVEEVKKTQTFKTELIKGIDLGQKNSAIQPVATTPQPTEATGQAAIVESTPDIIATSSDTPTQEKSKAQTSKLLTDTLKPLLSDNLNVVNLNNDTKVAQQAQPSVATTAPLAGAPQTANIEKQTAILSQFTTFMAVTKLRSETEVTLRLHPRELGDIKIQITRTENQALHEPATLSAKFQVNSEMVKSVLESNFNLLKDSLQQQGNFNMAQMSVDVQTNGSQNQGFQDNQESASPQGFYSNSIENEDHFVANTSPSLAMAHSGDLDRVA